MFLCFLAFALPSKCVLVQAIFLTSAALSSYYHSGISLLTLSSWDDWVPQDRLRKFSDENKELAQSLKKEMDALRQRTAPKVSAAFGKKKNASSDLSSTRGSEERNSSVPVTGRGQKRGRDFEIEKVCTEFSSSSASSTPHLESGTPNGPFTTPSTATSEGLASSPPLDAYKSWPISHDGAADTPAATSGADSSSSSLSSAPPSPPTGPTPQIEKGAKTTRIKDTKTATEGRAKISTAKKAQSAPIMLDTVEADGPNQAEEEPASKRRRTIKAQAKKPARAIAKDPNCSKDHSEAPSAIDLGKRKLLQEPEAADDET